jgi:hypothetical protein
LHLDNLLNLLHDFQPLLEKPLDLGGRIGLFDGNGGPGTEKQAGKTAHQDGLPKQMARL